MVTNKSLNFQRLEKTNHIRIIVSLLVLFLGLALAGCTEQTEDVKVVAAKSTMKPFGSKEAFAAFQKKASTLAAKEDNTANAADGVAAGAPSEPQSEAAPVAADIGSAEVSSKTSGPNPEITNNQNIGVDEGGIVKQVGKYLLTLQEGRIFVVNTQGGDKNPLKLTDRFNVYRSKDTGAWYDEMLVSGNRVLITAYSYEDQATEISVFTLSDNGKLSRNGRFMLSSYDYFSSENYATRLVGDNLVIYTPHSVFQLDPKARERWPSLTVMGDVNAKTGKVTPLFNESDIYAPGYDYPSMMVHAVSVCSLKGVANADQVGCKTTSFIGAPSRELYVSGQDAFIWSTDFDPYYEGIRNLAAKAAVYRVPLSGDAPSMLGVRGAPIDQFSMESRDGRFMMLMDQSHIKQQLAFLNVSLADFGAQYEERKADDYVLLSKIGGGKIVNRFVGESLLIGLTDVEKSYDMPASQKRNATSFLGSVPINNPKAYISRVVPFNIKRIERAGNNAVLTGYDQEQASLHFTMVNLDEGIASLGASLKIEGTQESESRSHGFGASIDANGNGLIGIPTQKASPGGLTWSSDQSETSDISFITVTPNALSPAGSFTVNGRAPSNGYACEVSCIDWYGNARPIFTGGRIFGMMGTELVEGRMERGQMQTIHRLDLTGAVG
jgi:hypothetical protein